MHRTIGFAIAKPAEVLGAEPYLHELITGVERVLLPRDGSILLRVVRTPAEVALTIRRWAAAGAVDAVVLMDLQPEDPLVGLVKELELPAVVIGDPETALGLPAVWAQDDVVMAAAVDAILALGHTRIAHVSGPGSMAHTRLRVKVFDAVTAEAGADTSWREGDYSERSGYRATTALLSETEPPTAIIADNDLMAIGALDAATARGVKVPDELSILAWDDSALCQLSSPALSAMSHDVQTLGELIGSTVLAAIDRDAPATVSAPAAEFVSRQSTTRPLS